MATRTRNELILADMIASRAEAFPDHRVLTFDGGGVRADEVRTYADLWANGNRLAAGLIARGLEKGDRFALLMRNHPEFVETMVATSISGGVMVPVDPRTKGDKLAYMLTNSECTGVVCADYVLANVADVLDRVPALKWLLVLESGEEPGALPTAEVPRAEPLGALLDTPETTVDVRLDSGSDPFEIMYTSGTTGDPKGIVIRNERYGGAAMVGLLVGYRPGEERPYTGLSLTHGNAQFITLASTLGMRLSATYSSKFTKSRLWDITRKYGCTTFNLLGGMATALYSEPPRPDDADNPVEFVLSAGMPPQLWEAFERRFDVKILECYGAMEGGLAIKPIGQGPIGSFGKPPPTMEMQIVDDDGNECPAGEIGELICRPKDAPHPDVEYHGNEAASKAKTRGGWLRTGDMCHQDADGWFFFDFRKGGGIRHNGDFVNPGFVEKVVAEHPDVDDVFVYGVPAASGAPGEKDVVAAVVARDRAAFDSGAVFAHCRRGLESNFVPTYLQLVDEIPKTASEKPQERFLLDRFAPDAADVYVEN